MGKIWSNRRRWTRQVAKCQGLSKKYKPCNCVYEDRDHQDYDTFECGEIVGIGFENGLSGARDKFDNEEGGSYTNWDDSNGQGSSTSMYLFGVIRKGEVPPAQCIAPKKEPRTNRR